MQLTSDAIAKSTTMGQYQQMTSENEGIVTPIRASCAMGIFMTQADAGTMNIKPADHGHEVR
jgi:hypothetical protein